MHFFSKLRSILEVDFLNLCIYLQTLKYIELKVDFLILCIFMFKLRSIFEVCFLNTAFLSKLKSILEVYLISKKVKRYK